MIESYSYFGVTTFHAAIGVTYGHELGVCLMSGPQPPLSCAKVAVDTDGTVSAKGLDLDSAPASVEIVDAVPDPECNTCWIVEP